MKKGVIFTFRAVASFLSPCSNIRCFKIDQPSAGDASGAPAVWSHGYTEASGVKNKYDPAWFSFTRGRELTQRNPFFFFSGSFGDVWGLPKAEAVPWLRVCVAGPCLAPRFGLLLGKLLRYGCQRRILSAQDSGACKRSGCLKAFSSLQSCFIFNQRMFTKQIGDAKGRGRMAKALNIHSARSSCD